MQRERVRQVLGQTAEKGLPVSQFIKSYEARTGANLDVSTLGFSDLVDFLKALDDFVEILGGSDFPKMRVRLRPSQRDDLAQQLAKLTHDYPSQSSASKSKTTTVLPTRPQTLSVVLPGEDLMRPQELPDEAVIDQYLEVRVGEVYNPGKFYIQLNHKYNDLMKLMGELEKFYENKERSEKYLLPSSAILEGQFVAALYHDGYEESWHRGYISKIKDTNHVEVYYLDYGTVSRVRISKLRYLHRTFSELPAQAIRARMASIQPPGGRFNSWSKESGDRLLELVRPSAGLGHVAKIEGFQHIQVSRVGIFQFSFCVYHCC